MLNPPMAGFFMAEKKEFIMKGKKGKGGKGRGKPCGSCYAMGA